MLLLSRRSAPLAPSFACVLTLCSLCLPSFSRAESLRITSNPPGATIELDGVPVGNTPFQKDFPGGYFHRTRTVLGQRLEHPMVARISLAGYSTHEIALTEGPMDWIDLHGRHHGQYWLFKSDHFHVDLDTIASTFSGIVSASAAARPASFQPELSLEELVRRAKPAVVCLKGFDSMGSGFFVTETGVIATNAHVVRGDSTLVALLADGTQLPAKVVYIDADFDIALVKATAPSAGFAFLHLPLADATLVRQGEAVLAIGNPGDAMLFSATKGIVSAVGRFPSAGPGTWIQTDAPINPGNSGGPLLNEHGEVIGLNTLKMVRKNVTGIGFALSAGDLLTVLRRFYPDLAAPANIAAPPRLSEDAAGAEKSGASPIPVATESTDSATSSNASPPFTPAPSGFGVLSITSEPDGAEIYVDGKFHGNAPATLKLAAGSHAIVLKSPGLAECTRTIEVPPSSKLTLKAVLLKSDSPQ